MGETLDIIAQIGIAVFGVAAIFLVARKNKWGFIVGLMAQPFWFYTSFYNKQWGVFVLSFAYLATWILGVYEWFIKPKRAEAPKTKPN